MIRYGKLKVDLDFDTGCAPDEIIPAGTLVRFTGPDGDGYIFNVTVVGRPECSMFEILEGAVRPLTPLEMLALAAQ